MIRFFNLIFFYSLLLSVKANPAPNSYKPDAQAYVQTLKKLTDVMVGDVTGPCAAARYYAYANMAAYEIIYQQARPAHYVSFSGLLKGYPDFSAIKPSQTIDVEVASLYAVLRAGEELLPSGFTLENARKQLVQDAGNSISPAVLAASCAYADSIVKGIVKYAARDGYVKTSGYMRYTPLKEVGSWQPTPPGYMEAYEPHWGSLRPFLLDSAAQFPPAPPVAYNQQKKFWLLYVSQRSI